MDTARRQFLSQSILSAAALTLPFAACARQTPAATAAPATPVAAPAGKLLMRTIPASGEAIPAIGGTWTSAKPISKNTGNRYIAAAPVREKTHSSTARFTLAAVLEMIKKK